MEKTTHSAEYKVFLKLLVSKRNKSGATQSELAEKLGLTQSAYSKLERGELRIDLLQLRRILIEIGADMVGFVSEFEQHLRQKPAPSPRSRK